MSKVIADITMSLDGFIAGPEISRQHPLGKKGERLHEWLFNNKTAADTAILDELTANAGAVIIGNRTYTTAINDAWEGVSPFNVPAFVICKTIPDTAVYGFTFVTDGIAPALKKAKAIAGDKNVWVMGGANIIQQYLKTGLADELHIHIVPVLFLQGTRLFDHLKSARIELKKLTVINTPAATHFQFEVLK